MSRSPEGPDSDFLFDLPLDGPLEEASDSVEPPTAEAPAGGSDGGDQVALDFPPEGAPHEDPGPPSFKEAPLGSRFAAAALDLVVLLAVLGLALFALRILGVPLSSAVMAPMAVFLASFSFLYTVVPLAFWGHTPGMAYTGTMTRTQDRGFLTIQQCILRWIGWILTLGTAGFAALLALSGVSIADVLSRSRVFLRETP